MKRNVLPLALKTTLVYALFAAAWILGSDHLLLWLTHDANFLTELQTIKGLVFILVSALLIFGLQRRDLGRLAHSAAELRDAYDQTIEGWSRALDLRDKETEGHSHRVTEYCVRLAASFGLSEEELRDMRHGAQLHDIGKVGIPDQILLKPGPLSDAEWAVMRQHPSFARGLLAPIAHLQRALDIPYCHHEKWDGSGYPQGLRGEEIPLPARIFAVVDVWDALTSDRPYRPAWAPERVRELIRAEAGRHFDPAVVARFLQLELPSTPAEAPPRPAPAPIDFRSPRP